MSTDDPLEPLAAYDPFSMATLQDACSLAARDPASLTNWHLRHIATYDLPGARAALLKRDQARAVPPPAPRRAPAAPAPAAAPMSAQDLAEVILRTTERAAAPIAARLTAIEAQLPDLEAAIAKAKAAGGSRAPDAFFPRHVSFASTDDADTRWRKTVETFDAATDHVVATAWVRLETQLRVQGYAPDEIEAVRAAQQDELVTWRLESLAQLCADLAALEA